MESKMTSKGQITIPKEIREALELKPGDKVALTIVGDEVIMTRRNREWSDLIGFLGDPPGGPATLEELDEAVKEAVGRHVLGLDGDDHEDAA
jgi:antitoxin PrlF